MAVARLAVVVLLAVLCNAHPEGACVEVSSAQLVTSQCQAVVDYPVFLPDGLSVEELDAAAAGAGTGVVQLGLVSPQCADLMMTFVCTSVFRPCDQVDVNGVLVALPKPPCRETCSMFVEHCGSEPALLASGASPLDCDAVDETTQAVFPAIDSDGYSFPLEDGTSVSVQCASTEATVVAAYRAIPNGHCEPMNETVYSQCSSLIDHDVFVPTGGSQEELDFEAYKNSFALLWKALPSQCSAASFRFLCTSSFLGCDSFPLGPGLVLSVPRAPCQQVCNEFNWYCEEVLVTEEEDNRAPCETLPPDVTVIPVAEGLELTSTCVYAPTNVSLYRTCSPYTAEDSDGECVLECPSPLFTPTEWDIYMAVISVCGWLSSLSVIAVVVAFACHPLKRQYPKHAPAFHMAYFFLTLCTSTWYSFAGGIANLSCVDERAAQRDDTAFCVLSALFVHIGAWCSIFWYNWVGLTLLLALSGLDKLPKWLMQVLMHAIPLIFSVVWTVVMIITDNMVNTGTGICALNTTRWNEWFQDVFFWLPYCVLWITASVCLFSVFSYAVLITGWKGIVAYWRIMAYLLVGILATSYSLTYHWEVRIEEDSIRRNLEGWLTCAASEIDYERCKAGRLLPFTPFLINAMVGHAAAVLIALILLSDPQFFQHWRYLFLKYVMRRTNTPYPFKDAERAKKLSTHMKSLSRTSQSAGSSGASGFSTLG